MQIAESAVQKQRFVAPPFKMDRMTWIKPSFLWMMYRSGWASKESQERILEIRLLRTSFEACIKAGCLTRFVPAKHGTFAKWREAIAMTDVRIQWDPDRDIHLQPTQHRTIQIGLSGTTLSDFANNWILEIRDITPQVKQMYEFMVRGDASSASKLLPREFAYSFRLSRQVFAHIL